MLELILEDNTQGKSMTYDDVREKIASAYQQEILGNLETSLEIVHQVLSYLDTDDSGHFDEIQKAQLKSHALNQLANVASERGDIVKAFEHYTTALALAEQSGNEEIVVACLCNIGNLHTDIGNEEMSFQFLQSALTVAKKINHKHYQANIYCNIAGYHHSQGDIQTAIHDYNTSLALYQEIHDERGEALIYSNLGGLNFQEGNHEQGVEYLKRSLEITERIGDKSRTILNLDNLGAVYQEESYKGYDYAKSEMYLTRALGLSKELGSKDDQLYIHTSFASLYKRQQQWEKAFHHIEEQLSLHQEITTLEAKKLSDKVGYERQVAEREKQLAIERVQHDATEKLLYNVLPEVIAQRILSGTTLIAERLQNVSVLFADIVEFTRLSQRISPDELVIGLNRIFSVFDELAEKYNIEKIKTIGDAYMVIAGAPEARADHAEVILQMAFDMIDAMKGFTAISTGENIQLRIGIHCGEVVAGVIGKKKFSFDLWGDAVNTAARMESHGEAGKIHVSEEFKNAVGEIHGLPLLFIERGEIDIKGKGTMRTYFLARA